MIGTRLITFAYILLAIGLILFIWLLIRTASRIVGKTDKTAKLRSRFGGFIDLIFLSIGVIFILCSQLFFWLSSNLKYHMPLDGKTEIGIVESYIRPDWDYKQGFKYTPTRTEGYDQTFSFELDGDTWYIVAEKIHWPVWTKLFGLATSFKVDSFHGGEGEPAVRDLVGRNYYELDGGRSRVLDSYDRFGGLLLGVNGTVIESKKRNFISGRSYTIYADSSGILLQEMW
ncbi:MAG: hypothetical protein GY863_18065 [bacterium]|nr:hypothetical protein [bacterium]